MRLTTHEPHIIYLSNNTMVSHKRNSHDDPLKNLDKKQPKFLGQLVNPSRLQVTWASKLDLPLVSRKSSIVSVKMGKE